MDRQTQLIEVKKALSETVLLNDGRYGFIISMFMDLGGHDKWECHVCSRIISTERAVLMHLSHPLHMSKLRVPHHPPENFKKIVTREQKEKDHKSDSLPKKKEDNSWDITESIRPGEPVPPGMEDIVTGGCQIQSTLDKHTLSPLIGIEYIVELVSTEDTVEPKYICLLCEKKGDPRSVMVHLTSYNHSLRYISCFFRTAGNALNMIPKGKDTRKGVAIAVNKIAEQIELHYGRLKPTSAVSESFTQHKNDILRQIDAKEHFRETSDTKFLDFCTPEKINQFTKMAEEEFNAANNKVNSEEEQPRGNPKEDEKKPDITKNVLQQKTLEPPTLDDKGNNKLKFSIGKPERSFGRNKESEKLKQSSPDDDEVIFVSANEDPIEIKSMSSISSASDDSRAFNPSSRGYKHRSRSLSRCRDRGGWRRRSPDYRRSPPHYIRIRNRSRSRSRSRDRDRFYRDRGYSAHRGNRGMKDDRDRGVRDDRRAIRGRRSRSFERDKDRYRFENSRRYGRDRQVRSISSEKDSRKRSVLPKTTSKLSPDRKKKKEGMTNEFKSKMNVYRKKLHEVEVEMDNKLKYFRERPEKHPQYSEEWKNFWNRRYKEIQQSGKDPTGYDFKPEWIVFWDEKMKELHETELEAKKEELKNLIPIEEKGPSSDLQDISPPTPDDSKEVTVDDIKNTWKALTGTEIKAPVKPKSLTPEKKVSVSPISERSPSPWEHDSRSSYSDPKQKPHRDTACSVVHVLRMFSVLEQQLGSLGPKALDLLSKALSFERIKQNEAMKLLEDSEIHIFFDTAKEKIRGQLIAGIVPRFLVNSCRNVISSAENMLAQNPPRSKPKPPPAPKPTILQAEPVKVAGVGMINKMAVAQQIAEVLVTQGRTDVTQQELEELINAVVGIASTTNANVNQSSAAFFSQLQIQNSTANSHINDILNNIITSAKKNSPTIRVEPNLAAVGISGQATQVASGPKTVLEKAADVPELLPEVSTTLLRAASSFMNSQSSKNINSVLSTNVDSSEGMQSKTIAQDDLEEVEEVKDNNKNVTDEELKNRLTKFKTLSRDEQQTLISLLKELENKEPLRVEKLRRYVTVGLSQIGQTAGSKQVLDGRLSPFSSRTGGTNPAPEETRRSAFVESDNDDDDDYDVADVYKSVSEKLKKKEDQKKPAGLNLPPPEILDEATMTSSHLGYNNPQANNLPTPPYSLTTSGPTQVSTVYSVAEPATIATLDRYNLPPPSTFPTPGATPYKSDQFQDKSWAQGAPGSYPPNRFPATYETSSYAHPGPGSYSAQTMQYKPQGPYTSPPGTYPSQDQYKGTSGPYPGNYPVRGYLPPDAIKAFPPTYNSQNNYQMNPYDNQGNYNYERPQGQQQGQGYYNNNSNNYRQY